MTKVIKFFLRIIKKEQVKNLENYLLLISNEYYR
jgi:hypothetical protein